jgi:phosphohistidine phosphatase
MIQLILIRHARAAHAANDHERPLTTSGEQDAARTAAAALRAGVRPHRVLSSTATRARQTAAIFADAFGAVVEERPELYGASAEEMMALARSTDDDEVAIVAHDPGLSELSTTLAEREVRMAPAAVSVFTWDRADAAAIGTATPDDVTLIAPS